MTVSENLLSLSDKFTASERRLLTTLLDDYPIIGLSNMNDLATAAGVSTTTVVRLMNKAGYDGFPHFQAALRKELKAMISDPISKKDAWRAGIPEGHVLSQYSHKALENLKRSVDDLDPSNFDEFCRSLCDMNQSVFVVGGRITGTVAEYFQMHLQMMRKNVRLVRNGGSWPHTILDLSKGDVVVVFDVRRYENTTLQMAQMCHDKGAKVYLFTDEWRSPVHSIAESTFIHRIVVPSAWDSMLPLMMLAECTIASVQDQLWEVVEERTGELEAMFDKTKLFRKFGKYSNE